MRYDFSIAKLVNVPSMACAFEERGACAWRAMCSDSDGEDEEVAYMIDIDLYCARTAPNQSSSVYSLEDPLNAQPQRAQRSQRRKRP